MRALFGLLAFSLSCAVLGCSSHDPKLEDKAPPRPGDVAAQGRKAANSSYRLLQRYRRDASSLPAEALAPLAQAAAIDARVTGAPGLRTIASSYGGQLLQAQVPAGTGTGFFSADSGNRADAAVTVDAGLALLDVYRVTGDDRFRSAAREAAIAVISPRLDWRKRGRAAGVAERGRFDVARTAQAGAFLTRARAETQADVGQQGRVALSTVLRNQAALGNWYRLTSTRRPQTLDQWASTLYSLFIVPTTRNQQVALPGTSKLWAAAFAADGTPKNNALTRGQPGAIAQSLIALAASPDQTNATKALRQVQRNARSSGTAEFADPSDTVVQGRVALALALHARALKPR